MPSVIWNILVVAWHVAILPLTFVVFPIALLIWNIIKHTFVIPILLMLRTTLFGLVYLPLTPVLSAVRVKYDTEVPVEVSLYRLLVDISPHVRFFLVNLLHYVMISLFVGVIVGFFTGFNISIVMRFVVLPEDQPKRTRRTQTTPYVDALKQRIAEAEAKLKQESQEPQEPMEPPKPEPEVKAEPKEPLLSNVPAIKKEEPKEEPKKEQGLPFIRKPIITTPTEREGYEDDDGYNYLTYETPEPPQNTLQDSVHTILEEELEDDVLDPERYPGSLLAPTATLNSTWTGLTFTTNAETANSEATSDEERGLKGK